MTAEWPLLEIVAVTICCVPRLGVQDTRGVMFLCGMADSAAQEQPKVHRTLSTVARAVVSIPEAVLVNEFSSGENAGVVYYVMKKMPLLPPR